MESTYRTQERANEVTKEQTLGCYQKVVIETDEDEPETVAAFQNGEWEFKEGYRARLTPYYD